MITTVTLNTSVDKLYLVEKLEDYTVMRVKKVSNTAGGKGLNVSKVAYLLGEKVSALGFAGGFNGSYVSSLLEAQGIRAGFTRIQAETRSCINIRELSTGRHTEFLEPGAPVTHAECDEFLSGYKFPGSNNFRQRSCRRGSGFLRKIGFLGETGGDSSNCGYQRSFAGGDRKGKAHDD